MKIILLILFFAPALLSTPAFADEWDGTIEITKEDQACLKDKDCVFALTDCGADVCECPGRPVNRMYRKKYSKLLEECRERTEGVTVCTSLCAQPKLRCLNKLCFSMASIFQN